MANRQDTTHKAEYPKHQMTNPFSKQNTARTTERKNVDNVKANLQDTDGQSRKTETASVYSHRTVSSKGSNRPERFNDVVKLQPVENREEYNRATNAVQVDTQLNQNLFDSQNTNSSQVKMVKRNDEQYEYVRSKTKGDTNGYQNPTFKSQILNSPTKVQKRHEQHLPQEKTWETTTRQAYDLPFAMKKEANTNFVYSKKETDVPDYKAWRRQPTEALQSPRQYNKGEREEYDMNSPGRKGTTQDVENLKEHFYQSPGKENTEHARDLNYRYRKDDQIFPHEVDYEGDHNRIVHEKTANELYNINPVYRQINDDRIRYGDSSIERAKVIVYWVKCIGQWDLVSYEA